VLTQPPWAPEGSNGNVEGSGALHDGDLILIGVGQSRPLALHQRTHLVHGDVM